MSDVFCLGLVTLLLAQWRRHNFGDWVIKNMFGLKTLAVLYTFSTTLRSLCLFINVNPSV